MTSIEKCWKRSNEVQLSLLYFNNEVMEGFEVMVKDGHSVSFFPSREELDEMIEFLQVIREKSSHRRKFNEARDYICSRKTDMPFAEWEVDLIAEWYANSNETDPKVAWKKFTIF